MNKRRLNSPETAARVEANIVSRAYAKDAHSWQVRAAFLSSIAARSATNHAKFAAEAERLAIDAQKAARELESEVSTKAKLSGESRVEDLRKVLTVLAQQFEDLTVRLGGTPQS